MHSIERCQDSHTPPNHPVCLEETLLLAKQLVCRKPEEEEEEEATTTGSL